ncbi:cytochrome c-type biogenesis protein [Vibrio gallicus]|uniref:cytochrome c-type biogenesis protein n=1 Tax=Vibrio gallicus TaxID=190897 RepID=UPI0021C2F37B|nr:cytochrome c-type biogenesis protein [Vibrio gallicus]
MKKWLVALAMLFSVSAYAAIEIHQFDTPEQERQFHELNQTLRCPKCQNNSIGDSNAELAIDLRQKVYEMTKEGKSRQEIVDYMVARYGNFVTYQPPFTLGTAILWFGPLLVVLIGFSIMITRTKRNKKQAQQLSSADTERLNSLLNDKDGDSK